MNFLQDIRVAAQTFREIREARKAGASGIRFVAEHTYTIPFVKIGYWTQTPEACLFFGEQWRVIQDVFNSFGEDTQHALTFTPKDGEWPDRVRFWQQHLKPVLPPKQYHRAMTILIQWCIRCVRRRREAVQA